ncbi:MAG: AAA family ATPase, partial [Chitinophagales bacterium]
MEENQYQDANEQENPQTEEGDLMQYTPANAQQQAAIAALNQCVEELKNELNKVLIGQTATVDLLLASLFSRGHVLLEGVPGIAKTLIARLLSKSLSVGFSRIQFTPDLMPTDVVGTSIFDMQSSDFKFKAGPVFSNFILIDEINRAPAKTQAALFEVMEEQQVTVDGVTHPMSFPFFVIATQ